MATHPRQADPSGFEFTDLWYDAITAYQRETKRELELDKLKLYLRTPEDILVYIESQGDQFTNFRDKHGKLWTRMHAFIAPITAIGNTASTSINSVAPFGPPVSAVLGAVVYLVKAADKVKDAFDWIQTLFGEFELFATRLEQYFTPTQEMSSALQKRLVAILICLLRLIGRSEALIKGGRFKEYLKCAFLGKDERTKGLLDDLNVQLNGEKGLVLALTYAATRNAEDFSQQAASSSKEAAETATRIETRMEEQMKQEIDMKQVDHMKQTLDTPAADLVCKLLSTQKQDLIDGTGTWLEKESLFNDWVNGRAPILWIFGGPGSGKSFLATRTVLYLQERFNQTLNSSCKTAVAYFFIRDSDACLLDPNNILKTLASQIAEVDTTFRQYAASACASRASTITENDTWEKIFMGFYSTPEATDHYAFLILDGLDEASQSTRRTLLGMAKTVTDPSRGTTIGDHIQFGIFGRPEIRGDFEFKRQEKYIEVSSSRNQDDMRNFILSKIPGLALIKEMKNKGAPGRQQAKKLSRTIVQQVLQGADGVFLWAKLLMKELEELNQAKMRQALTNPPQSLDDMIHKLLHRISEDDSIDFAETNKMLTLICFAQRPLLFGELKLFLSLPDQQPNMLLWRNIRGRFASLFELEYPFWGYDPDLDQDDDEDGGPTVDENATYDESQSNQEDGQVLSNDRATSGDNDNDIAGEDDEDDEDGDDDAEFDFDDVCGLSAATYDLGLTPRGDKETEEYASKLHDSDSQLTTLVHFTHLRVKDFLLMRGRPDTTGHVDRIHVDPGRAEIEMTICCLQALRQGHETQEHRAYLVEYAGRYFVTHLANVRDEFLTSEDIEEILRGLVQVLHSTQTAKALIIGAGRGSETRTGRDDFWMTWISSQQHREVVQQWLRKPEVETVIDDNGTRDWVHQARDSVRTLLKPMIRGASEIWLTKTGYDDEGYRDKSHWLVEVICAYISMDEGGQLTNEAYQQWSWINVGSVSQPESALIYAAAEWAELDKTTHWHTGVGWILMDSGWPTQAIEEFDKAIQLDPKAWVAQEGKARCLSWDGLYEDVIQTMTQAIENLPETMASLNAFLLPQISDWKAASGDSDGSYEAAVQGFQMDSGSLIAQDRYIAVHSVREDGAQEIVNTLETLHGWRLNEGHSMLTNFFISGHGYSRYQEIGTACRKCDKPGFLLEAMDESLTWSKKNRNKQEIIWRTDIAAHVRYAYYEDDDEAVKLWEESLDEMSHLPPPWSDDDRASRVAAVNNLSRVHFDMAVAAKREGQGYSRLATRLKELSIALISSLEEDSFEFYDSGYPALLWGRWLREHENAETSVWRAPFRASILDQMNQLDDDDPANDTDALRALARGLFHAGQSRDAGAILAILLKPLEDLIRDRNGHASAEPVTGAPDTDDGLVEGPETHNRGSHGEDANQDQSDLPTSHASVDGQRRRKEKGSELKMEISENSWAYSCDNCKQDTDLADEMYFCEICEDINWCGECLPLVREGGLVQRQCNPGHSFYRAWPIPEDARDRGATWLESVPELRRDWLENLRREWL